MTNISRLPYVPPTRSKGLDWSSTNPWPESNLSPRRASPCTDIYPLGGVRIFVGGLLTPFEASYSKFKEKLDRNTRLVDSVAQALNIQDQGKFRRAQEMENSAAQEVIKNLERASSFPREEQGQTCIPNLKSGKYQLTIHSYEARRYSTMDSRGSIFKN
jgi:hypothetical protein